MTADSLARLTKALYVTYRFSASLSSKPHRKRNRIRPVRGIISGFVVVRLLLVPAIVGALEALATSIIPIPQARLGRAVLLISSGMPTAQIMIVLLHKFGLSQQASELSFLFVFQYAASIPTMTALISSVLNRVY